MKRILCAGLALMACNVLLSPAAEAAKEKMLDRKTMEAGGSVTFDIDHVSDGASATGFKINVAPSAGYFVIDRLEIGGGLTLTLPFGDLYQGAGKNFGVSAFGKYYFALGHEVHLYAGLQVGPSFAVPDKGDTQTSMAIAIPVGLLYPLNDRVGVMLGTSIGYAIGISKGSASTLHIPIGYLGIQSFFDL